MPNGNTLTSFKKGHKKLGGRKRGVPNKFPRDLREAILAGAEHVGLDGHGFGGLTGYMIRLAIKHPKSFAALLGRLLPTQAANPPPPRHSLDLGKLTDEEIDIMERLTMKAQMQLPPDAAAPLQPFDDDQCQEKIDELLGTTRVKKK
jgi:hypothetical protein